MKTVAKWTTIALVGAGLVSLVSIKFGKGARCFFSPDTLEFRYQSEYLVPLLLVPLYRSRYTYAEEPNELVTFLVEEGYWEPRQVDDPRWICVFHWNHQWRDGYGQMYRHFCRSPELLIEWSRENPELAAVMWPKVLAVLRDKAMPSGYAEDLIFQARHVKSVDEYYRVINNSPEHQSVGIHFP